MERAVVRGNLHRLHRGVYAVGHRNLSLQGECLAAVLGCGPGALLSHWSAAWLWGVLSTRPVPVHVTTPIPRRARSGLRIHRSRSIGDEDRTLREAIPVTSLPRTALDVAARVRHRSLDRLLRRSEELRLIDLPAFESLLARNRGHRGAGPLRRALALYRPAPFTRSGLEDLFLELVEAAGIPKPVTGYNEAGYELDVYWPELRFAVELGIFETHGTRLSFEQDAIRQEELKLAGVEMIEITGQRLDREPESVMRRVTTLLERRRHELAFSRSAGGAR